MFLFETIFIKLRINLEWNIHELEQVVRICLQSIKSILQSLCANTDTGNTEISAAEKASAKRPPACTAVRIERFPQ